MRGAVQQVRPTIHRKLANKTQIAGKDDLNRFEIPRVVQRPYSPL